MKKTLIICTLGVLVVAGLCACSKSCPTEPIVEENQKLIVPPNFGKKPA